MDLLVLGAVGAAMLGTLAIGLLAHELAHAAVLRAFGIHVDVEWRPGSPVDRRFIRLFAAPVATVTPRRVPPGVSPHGVRLAALAPLVLATPGALVLAGVLPDPMAAGNPFLAATTIAWLGCALPSPQDFSLFWHVDRVLGDEGRHVAGTR